MFENFKPFNHESKEQIMIRIDISGQMDAQGAKEVARAANEIAAQGKKWFWIFVGFGVGFAVLCFGVSLIKWW